ncbi:MAG: EamA family transporter [Spirochaetales bacterium]|nr:EamA family transporter [Spirochaetales bacterium]
MDIPSKSRTDSKERGAARKPAATGAGQYRGSGPAVVSILLWCWSGVCMRKGAESMGPMAYLTFMTGGGSLVAVLLQLLRRKPPGALFRLPPRVIVAGFFGVAVYTVALSLAFGMAEPRDLGLVNLLNYLWPLWIVILSILLLRERPRPVPVLAGVLLGFAGLVASRMNGFSWPGELNLLPCLFALAGGFLWALYSVLLRRWNVPEENGGTAFHFAACAVLAAIIAAATGEWKRLAGVGPETVFWIVFGAAGPVGIAYYLWELGMKKGGVQLLASLSYFIPIGSSLLIGLLFKEAMSWGLLPGAVMIAGGAMLVRSAHVR